MAVDGVNYLVPRDAAFEDKTVLDVVAVPVDFVTRQMLLSNGVSLVFPHACRANPLAIPLSHSMRATRLVAVSNKLAEMNISNTSDGTTLVFATRPGNVALNGDGAKSPFSGAPLRDLTAGNTDSAKVLLCARHSARSKPQLLCGRQIKPSSQH